MHLPFSFWKSSAPPPTPQAMYYTDMGSALWSDAANWFSDYSLTIPAGRVPINGDTITVNGIFSDNAPTLTIAGYYGAGAYYADYQTSALTVSAMGGVNISLGIWGGNNESGATGYFSGSAIMGSIPANGAQWTGSCEFHDSAHNEGQVGMYAYFYDTSYNGGTGSVYVPSFYDNSCNQGFFADAYFYNYSYNGNSFGGNSGQFYDYSINYGYFSMGTNRFYDYSQNDTSGSCSGTTEFYNWATNHASYLGYGIFYGNSGDFGATYSGYYYDYSSTQSGNITGYAYFYNGATNSGENYYDAQFSDTSANLGTCDLTASFYGYSYNDGTVHSNAYFYGSSENASAGVINDNFEATANLFTDNSKNYGIAYYHTDLYSYAINYAFVGQGNFYDYTENAAGAHANIMAYFWGSSINNGTTNADADFHDTSINYGYVTGLAQFFDASNNYGTYGTVYCSTSGICP